MVRISVSRTINAPTPRVWALLSDLERWPDWAPLSAMNRVVSHSIVSRSADTIVCDEYDQASFVKARHRDKCMLRPADTSLEETIIQGDIGGTVKLSMAATNEGTAARVEADLAPRHPWVWFLNALAGGKLLNQFWVDFLSQLANVAETPCSPQEPMYCPSRMLDTYFDAPSLPMHTLLNTGGREIDIKRKTIFDDTRWKGIYPPDSLLPAWVFQNGFNKKFWREGDGQVKGITSTFDDTIQGHNRLSLVDQNDPTKGILLDYVEPQYALFYDILKPTSENIVVGKVFTGRFPNGILLLNFTMARRYSFDFMSAQDHRELWEKYGKAPDPGKIAGEWEGRMVSNASLTPPLFRFWYTLDQAGKIHCKWNFMNILKGTSKLQLTLEQLDMFDFTNFHDEIRMIADDAMVGKYLPKGEKILNIIGDRDLGLIHFEKTSEGTRPVIYYYIRKVSGP